jgi:hypothetical protein
MFGLKHTPSPSREGKVSLQIFIFIFNEGFGVLRRSYFDVDTPLAPLKRGMYPCYYLCLFVIRNLGFENVLILMENTPLAPLERGMCLCKYLCLFLMRVSNLKKKLIICTPSSPLERGWGCVPLVQI